MLAFLIRRLLVLGASLFAASIVIFILMEILPGDPASFMLGVNAQPDTLAALRAELGLDLPPFERYMAWVLGMLSGDFGLSYAYRMPVADLIAERLAVSLPLTLYAQTLALLVGVTIGLSAAMHRKGLWDLTVMGIAQIGIAIPDFWFAMIAVLIFSISLGWFSAGGFPGWDLGIMNGLYALTLPAISLALPQASILARVTRAAILETLSADYIRTAYAKGLSRQQIFYRHALSNAAVPILTIIGLQFSFLLSGAIIIESVFYLPGLGRLVLQSVGQRDLIVVESIVMILVFAVIMVSFLVDIAYRVIDPRIGGNKR